jgi:hypothetical protein
MARIGACSREDFSPPLRVLAGDIPRIGIAYVTDSINRIDLSIAKT